MITKIRIENFRSIKKLEFEPNNLCALIGRNNAGKSNILSAIDLLLGEKWPANRISEDDIYNHDKSLNMRIQIFFSESINYEYYGQTLKAEGFELRHNFNKGTNLLCLDKQGNCVLTKYSKELYLNSIIREQAPCISVGVNRDLVREFSGSQWTLFGKLLKEIEREFLTNNTRKSHYQSGMKDVSKLLRIKL